MMSWQCFDYMRNQDIEYDMNQYLSNSQITSNQSNKTSQCGYDVYHLSVVCF